MVSGQWDVEKHHRPQSCDVRGTLRRRIKTNQNESPRLRPRGRGTGGRCAMLGLTPSAQPSPPVGLTGVGFFENLRKWAKNKEKETLPLRTGGDTEGVDLPTLNRSVCAVFGGLIALPCIPSRSREGSFRKKPTPVSPVGAREQNRVFIGVLRFINTSVTSRPPLPTSYWPFPKFPNSLRSTARLRRWRAGICRARRVSFWSVVRGPLFVVRGLWSVVRCFLDLNDGGPFGRCR